MHLVLKMVVFRCYVSIPEDIYNDILAPQFFINLPALVCSEWTPKIWNLFFWHGQDFEVKLPRKLIEDLNALAGEVGVFWLGIVWDRWNMLVFALMQQHVQSTSNCNLFASTVCVNVHVCVYIHFLNSTYIYIYIYIPWSVIVFIQKSFWSTHLYVFLQKDMYYINVLSTADSEPPR